MSKIIKKRFLFFSSCPEHWGGSEELWSGAALNLANMGHEVHIIKNLVDHEHHRIKELAKAGAQIWDYWALPVRPIDYQMRRLLSKKKASQTPMPHIRWITNYLNKVTPHLAIVSQGENFDGLEFVAFCKMTKTPYALICQKASDHKWPAEMTVEAMRKAYSDAKRSYFVSRHNRELTECQMGQQIANAEIVANPIMTVAKEPLPWPTPADGIFRLACVARLFVLEKGQDVLLQTLALPKWRERPIKVSIYGKGMHESALRQAANYLKLSNIEFAGFSSNVTDIWETHHALILPSRSEGLPLALIEAMSCGRFGIVTKVGGNADVIDNGVTGYLSDGANVDSMDEALERAWENRSNWESVGIAAAKSLHSWLPNDPCSTMAEKILLMSEEATK